MRALIVGITGFVGPYLADSLRSQNIECAGVSRESISTGHPISLDGVPIHRVDVRNRNAVFSIIQQEKPDWVFHLAAISHVPASIANPELTFDVNVGGLFNVLEGLRRIEHKPRVLFVSTGNVYGQVDSGEDGFDENSPTKGTSPYSTSKLICEQLVHSYFEDFGVGAMIARPFNHTGPGQGPSFACPAFAKAIAEGIVRRQTVHLKTGRLDPERDISDVRDVVRAYTALAERGRPGEIYNICSGTMVSMQWVVDKLRNRAPIEVTVELDPAKVRPREIMRLGGNRSKLEAELDWVPVIPLEQTLEDLLAYSIAIEQAKYPGLQ